MRKTITEWSAYIKLTEKKIERLKKEIFTKPYMVVTVADSLVKKQEINKFTLDLKAKYDSMFKLSSNLQKVKSARQQFNANTMITVAGNIMTVATALDIWKNKDISQSEINKFLLTGNKMTNEENRFLEHYNDEKEEMVKKTTSGTRPISDKEKDFLIEAVEGLKPVVIDPLNLLEKYNSMNENNEDFLSEVNAKINIVNATEIVEIEIEL